MATEGPITWTPGAADLVSMNFVTPFELKNHTKRALKARFKQSVLSMVNEQYSVCDLYESGGT